MNKVSEVELCMIIANRKNRERIGLFYAKDGKWWTGVDNSTGEAWTERFDTEQEAKDWLSDKSKEI